jgi:hypothetical protein
MHVTFILGSGFLRNGIIVYLVGLVFIVAATLLLSGYLGGTGRIIGGITTTMSQNSTNQTGTTTVPSATTTPTTSVYFSSCQSKNAVAPILNGNFSTGTYYGWNATGPGFGAAPFNLTHANIVGGYYGSPWSGYSGNYFATTYAGGRSLQSGNLTSQPFEVTEPYLNFKIVSAQSNLLYVEVLQGAKASKYWYNTYNATGNRNASSTFLNASIPLLDTTFFCQNVSVRVVSGTVGTTSSKGYIAVGDFYMGKTPKSVAGILVNQSLS